MPVATLAQVGLCPQKGALLCCFRRIVTNKRYIVVRDAIGLNVPILGLTKPDCCLSLAAQLLAAGFERMYTVLTMSIACVHTSVCV